MESSLLLELITSTLLKRNIINLLNKTRGLSGVTTLRLLSLKCTHTIFGVI